MTELQAHFQAHLADQERAAAAAQQEQAQREKEEHERPDAQNATAPLGGDVSAVQQAGG